MTVLCMASQTELHSNSKHRNSLLASAATVRKHKFFNINEDIQIPDPRVFNDIYVPEWTDSMSLPNITQCAAHLELLQAINHIRREVLNSSSLDAILNIKPQKRTVVQ
ncbi:hypothetical protein CNMCM5623_000499 [Aspergillus felis]|uniref:Uncharacterized protein n=1 Tax=Aspergillus felis TaxID=1287682 RepID=A0A8H6Q4Q1_9EURO|nr:hypothetical protein CNMCM5623_000499 [Aspergillus felis]